jgi:hypothetical protein
MDSTHTHAFFQSAWPGFGTDSLTLQTLSNEAKRHFEQPTSTNLRGQFEKLKRQWQTDCALISSSHDLFAHPAYRSIVDLGPPVIPILLAELEQKPQHWTFALSQIAGINPVPPREAGKLRSMARAWLKWVRNPVTNGDLR